jgi:hypothetical protein
MPLVKMRSTARREVGLSILKGNSWLPLEVVAASRNKVGDNDEDNDVIEDPLGRPSILSSVN